MDKKHNVVFKFDKENERWYIEFQQIEDEDKKK
jgi:hypothetical protein